VAALKLTAKLTGDPDILVPDDLDPLRESGLSDDAILDVIAICAGFNVIDRVADALGFDQPDPDAVNKGAKFLLRFGYTLSSGVWLRMPPRFRGAKLDQYVAGLEALKRRVWEAPGSLAPEARRNVSRGEAVPEPLLSYARKILRNVTLVGEEDIRALAGAGYDEDQIFEATVSAALGAGIDRFEAGMRALGVGTNYP
jgi:hypothetical protein